MEAVVEERLGPSRSPPRARTVRALKCVLLEVGTMPQVTLDEETLERLDSLREEDEDYDELINELINIYEAEELTMYRSGDEI